MDSNKTIDLLIFDFDGTLLHLNIDWIELKKSLNITNESLDKVIQIYINEDNDKALQRITDTEIKAAIDKKIDSATLLLIEKLVNDFHIAILTRNSRRAVENALSNPRLESKIYIIGREDVRKLKPHTEGINKIIRHYGTSASRTLVIGDTYHDIEVAKKAGALSAIVANPILEYQPEGADFYLNNINDIDSLLKNP